MIANRRETIVLQWPAMATMLGLGALPIMLGLGSLAVMLSLGSAILSLGSAIWWFPMLQAETEP